MNGPVPILSATQAAAMRQQVDAMAAGLHATSVLPLTEAADPNLPLERGGRAAAVLGKPRTAGLGEPGDIVYRGEESIPIFVATPDLLAHYGIDPASIKAGTDLLTPRTSIAGYDLLGGGARNWRPTQQHVTLPAYRSLPNVLITTHGMTGNRIWLAHPPVLNLVTILAGLPMVAYAGAWLLAGREAPTIGRQPLDRLRPKGRGDGRRPAAGLSGAGRSPAPCATASRGCARRRAR